MLANVRSGEDVVEAAISLLSSKLKEPSLCAVWIPGIKSADRYLGRGLWT
jgi:hypothetical protein